MSDTFAPQSSFLEQTPSTTSAFDATAFDRRLKEIEAVENRWTLPKLPDAVRFDLANQDTEPGLVSRLLNGLDADYTVTPQPSPLSQVRFDLRDPEFGTSRLDRTRAVAAQIIGEEAPTAPTVDAVKRFKLEAIERGLLAPPEDGQVDSTWDPSLNSVRWDMIRQDYENDMKGEGWGSVPTKTVLDRIGDWTQPTSLLAAATDLDLFWDIGAIGDEFSSWGDKWRKLAQSDNPIDFGKNLIDAVTGPIDDIVLPALNIALLSTGVGSIAIGARIGWMAAYTGRGGALIRGLYHAGAVRDVGNMAAIGGASWTATKMMKSGRAGVRATGSMMEAWRGLDAVKGAKATAQLGMRMGFMAQAQDLLPGYETQGFSLADIPTIGAGADALYRVGKSPLALPVELLIAPYNIWSPGTFLRQGGEGLNVISKAGSQIVRYAGTTPGRMTAGAAVGLGIGALQGDDAGDLFEGMGYGAFAGAMLPYLGRSMKTVPGRIATGAALGGAVGAGTAVLADEDITDGAIIGAVTGASIVGSQSVWARHMDVDDRGLSKWIGQGGDFLQKLDYKPLADNQKVSYAFTRGTRRWLADDPDKLARFEQVMREKNSFRAAFADILGITEDQAAAAQTYVMVSAAIDHTAATQASLLGGRGSKNWWQRYHISKNKLTAQLRTFDLSNPSSLDIDDMIRATISDAPDTASWTSKFEKAKNEWDDARILQAAQEHNDKAGKTLQQLLSPENFPDVDNVVGQWGREGVDRSVSIIEDYLPQVMPTFGNWPKFVGQTEQVNQWVDAGLYDLAPIAAYKTPFGRSAKIDLEVSGVAKREAQQADDALLDALFGAESTVDTHKALKSGVVTPMAKISPAGKPTVMRLDTPDKQEIAERYAEIRDLTKASDRLRRLTETGGIKQLQDAAVARGLSDISEMPRKEFEALIDQLFTGGRSKVGAKHLKSFAERKGWSFADLKANMDSALDDLVNDPSWVDRFGLPATVRKSVDNMDVIETDGLAALKQRARQLAEKRKYTAARIDTDDWVARTRTVYGDEAADQLAAEIALMAEDGYKLVHGVEFMMPADLTQNAMFADFGTQQLNHMTLGNFFRKRLPAERRWMEERQQRIALADSFAARLGQDINPEDAKLTDILDDLYAQVLKPEMMAVSDRLKDYKNLSFVERKKLAAASSVAPQRLEDLAKTKGIVFSRLEAIGYSRDEIEAIYAAIPKFRNTQFDNLGLYSFEAKLRTRNELVQSLKFFSGTKYGESVWARGTQGRRLGAVIGGIQGYQEDGVEGALLGGAVGAAAGTVAVGGASRLAAGQINRAIDKAELARFGQLGDKYVRMRDFFRFTMSPLFDISRYTEGMMLAQTAAPTRLPDGSRITLPADMSPSGVRRRMAKIAQKAGKSKQDARRAADVEWEDMVGQWRKASQGEYDPEVLDATGNWFKSVGIMGFSPTDWMAGAFTELRRQGVGAEDAYQAVREMYTYGSRGRSAAELSVNFVFFPFSFQKKALGHIGKWMNDDLARSIIIHDAFKGFEILNEEFDLKERWANYLPIMGQLNKLNLLAFGVSPGRFGGINAQLFEAGYETVLAPFMPWGGAVRSDYERSELEQLTRSMLPVYNDIDWMWKNLQEQKHVLASESHMTTRNQVTAGYREWNEYRQDLAAQLDEAGFTWSDMLRKPYLAETRMAYELKRAELAQKYPGWSESRKGSIGDRASVDIEKQDRLARAEGDPATATITDLQLAEMERQIESVRQELRYQGVDVSAGEGFLDAPPWAFEYIQELGVRMLMANPEWQRMWDQYYDSTFGILEAKVGMEFTA